LVRDPGKVSDDVRPNVEIAAGDLLDASALTRSLEGVQTMFFCIPASHSMPDVESYYAEFARSACKAIRAARTPRVVFVSSGGRGAKASGFFAALHAVEDELASTSAAVCFLRCGNFMENLLAQVGSIARADLISYPIAGDVGMPTVAAADIASVAAERCLDDEWTKSHAAPVHGPEDLTSNEVAERLGRLLGRQIVFRQASAEMFVKGLRLHGASDAFATAMVQMFRAVAEGAYAAEPRTPQSTTATTLDAWARHALVPAVTGFGKG
jgi:uncharacterized protein YbjT (DUF2867 family)